MNHIQGMTYQGVLYASREPDPQVVEGLFDLES